MRCENEDFELVLFDRLNVIRDVIQKNGEQKFYISFSGGKDSTVLHHLVDMALPGNTIPRVFANTGIEYNFIVDFVNELQKKDDRIIIIKPSKSIRKTLEMYGYPFKSKEHSAVVETYQKNGKFMQWSKSYYDGHYDKGGRYYGCPNRLKYQFSSEFNLKISDKCCLEMKEKPCDLYKKKSHRKIAILGLLADEGGRRSSVKCQVFTKKGMVSFSPLAKVTKEWEQWFIDTYNIQICKLYYPPYNFDRTGCKGCPFNINLQRDLETMDRYFPSERRQCELIWKPVYDEYRRLGYRLKKNENMKLF